MMVSDWLYLELPSKYYQQTHYTVCSTYSMLLFLVVCSMKLLDGFILRPARLNLKDEGEQQHASWQITAIFMIFTNMKIFLRDGLMPI